MLSLEPIYRTGVAIFQAHGFLKKALISQILPLEKSVVRPGGRRP
jgi:hypothetical protein